MIYTRYKKYYKFYVLIILAAALASAGLLACAADSLKESVTIEAGARAPGLAEFFLNNKPAGKFITDISKIDTSKIGETLIEIEIKNKIYESLLIIEDTIPPKGAPVELYKFKTSEVAPNDFVSDISDATQVTVEFGGPPPDLNKTGWQDVLIILTDEGGNTAEIISRLYIFDVLENLTLEAGGDLNLNSNLISIEDFVLNYTEPESGGLRLDWDGEPDFSALGVYRAVISPGGADEHIDFDDYADYFEVFEVFLTIEDTIPPTSESVELHVFKTSEVAPDDLVSDISDATQVTVGFGDPPPDLAKPGWQDVLIILTDEGENTTEIISRLYIFDVITTIVLEAGTVSGVSAGDFVRARENTDNLSLELNAAIDFNTPGVYHASLKCGAYETPVSVRIQDTTPPTATIRNRRVLINNPIPAGDFVTDIRDVSPVTVRYKTAPDFTTEGRQIIYIILEDAYGNIREYPAELNVVRDTRPPVISGELNKRVLVGGTISYRAGITVTDDWDENVELFIDSSAVNLNRAGVYTVIYSATDASGNKAEVKGAVTVFELNLEYVYERADEILAGILNAGMSKRGKAGAIYEWVCARISYTATNTPQDLAQRAYDGFTRGSGDCYTYMAASRVLLTRAGIDNAIAQRVPEAETPHFWNIVNTGDGWYHFDACPTPGNKIPDEQRFMFTESQARSYTQAITARDYYFVYDKSTVPEVVE